MKKTSVVILNWNGEKLLKQFLPSVINHTDLIDTDVVVADNCSTDDSVKYISENYPQIHIIELSQNYGYAKGYNEALKDIDSEYVVLLNSDVEVTDGWLAPIIKYMDEYNDTAAVQPKILSQRSKDYFEYAGAAGGFIDKYGYPFCRGRIFSKLEKDEGQYNNNKDIFWASGACLVIRLKEFRDAGEFDPTFFAHMEEIDLCWRLNARGKKIIYFFKSTVYHLGAATLSTENPRKTFLNFRNNLLMLYKNIPEEELKSTLNIRIFLDYLAAMQLFLSGKFKNARAITEAHREFNKIKKNYISERNLNVQKTVNFNIKTIYPKSILWTYYIKGKKLFSDLEL